MKLASALVEENTGAQGLGAERPGLVAIGKAADQVDDHFALYGEREPRAQLQPLGEVGGEGLAHGRRSAAGKGR